MEGARGPTEMRDAKRMLIRDKHVTLSMITVFECCGGHGHGSISDSAEKIKD